MLSSLLSRPARIRCFGELPNRAQDGSHAPEEKGYGVEVPIINFSLLLANSQALITAF